MQHLYPAKNVYIDWRTTTNQYFRDNTIDLNSHFRIKDNRMTNKLMKNVQSQKEVKEVQAKISNWYHYKTTRMTEIKNTVNTIMIIH